MVHVTPRRFGLPARAISVALAAMMIASCGGSDTRSNAAANAPSGASTPDVSANSAPKPPAVDLSTPDRAMRSFWATLDHVELAEHMERQKQLSGLLAVRAPMAAVTIGDYAKEAVAAFKAERETFAREISEVKVESESRAVVLTTVRNTTPVPPGAEESPRMRKEREDGGRYRYILEKEKNEWKVAEVWYWADYSSKWSKLRPSDGKPRYPYMTLHGTF